MAACSKSSHGIFCSFPYTLYITSAEPGILQTFSPCAVKMKLACASRATSTQPKVIAAKGQKYLLGFLGKNNKSQCLDEGVLLAMVHLIHYLCSKKNKPYLWTK